MKTFIKLVAVAMVALPVMGAAAIPMEMNGPKFEKCPVCGMMNYKCICNWPK